MAYKIDPTKKKAFFPAGTTFGLSLRAQLIRTYADIFFNKLSNMKTRTFFDQFTQYPLLSGPSLALVIVFASGQYNLDRQTLSERNNMEVTMFMRNVRNEIENHSDGCIFLKNKIENHPGGYNSEKNNWKSSWRVYFLRLSNI